MTKLQIIVILIALLAVGFIGYLSYNIRHSMNKSEKIMEDFKKYEEDFNKAHQNSLEKPSKHYSVSNMPKVVLLKSTTTAIINDMEEIKTTLVKLGAKDHFDSNVSNYLFKQKHAEKLKATLQGYKDFIAETFNGQLTGHPEAKIAIEDTINGNRKKVKWENHNFENNSLTGIVTILTFMQNNVKEVKLEVLRQLE